VHYLDVRVAPAAWAGASCEHAGEAPPHARSGHAAFVRGSSVWIFGGLSATFEPLGDVHELDTVTRAWTSRFINAAAAPAPRHAHSLSYDPVHDCALLFGGADAREQPLGDLWRLDPAAGAAGGNVTWGRVETHGVAPEAREMHAACIVQVDAGRAAPSVLVVHGGRSKGTVLRDMWLLPTDTLAWQLVATHYARCSHGLSPWPLCSAYAESAYLVSFGGFDGSRMHDSILKVRLRRNADGVPEADMEDVGADIKAETPGERFAHAQASAAHAIYIFGGVSQSGSLGDTSRLDLKVQF